jgi:hypothetical protein
LAIYEVLVRRDASGFVGYVVLARLRYPARTPRPYYVLPSRLRRARAEGGGFSPSSPRTSFAIVRAMPGAFGALSRPLYPRRGGASQPELPPVVRGDEIDVLVAVATDELVYEGAERQHLEPALAGVV